MKIYLTLELALICPYSVLKTLACKMFSKTRGTTESSIPQSEIQILLYQAYFFLAFLASALNLPDCVHALIHGDTTALQYILMAFLTKFVFPVIFNS